MHTYPYPFPDPELERLRRLDEQTRRDDEKREIVERLRRRGVPEDVIHPPTRWPVFPSTPVAPPGLPPAWPPMVTQPVPTTTPMPRVREIIERIQNPHGILPGNAVVADPFTPVLALGPPAPSWTGGVP